jgi:hypothetical protein
MEITNFFEGVEDGALSIEDIAADFLFLVFPVVDDAFGELLSLDSKLSILLSKSSKLQKLHSG